MSTPHTPSSEPRRQRKPPPPRRMPVGAEVLADGKVHFRVWAPARRAVEVVLDDRDGVLPLTAERGGYFSGGRKGFCAAGDRYRLRLDGGASFPDPASRFQPEGPHGPSQIVDPSRFAWSDADWRGVPARDRVVYELHVGTFTPEGTWIAAAGQLPRLRDLGITVIEVMPVADFPGRFGWGYDGVNLFAPTRLYGAPDDFRGFVDRAHGLGLGVILDVVYNHLGPDGNYLREFSPDYFTDRYDNEWGDPINFDGGLSPVRELFIENARYWIDEFHLDGLRLDATQQIYDASKEYVVAAIARVCRAAAGERTLFLVAENEPQDTRLVRPLGQGGYGLDAVWNDDLHHSATAALTGRHEAYYSETLGTAQELLSAVKWGFLYQGQWYHWQKQPRGTPALDLPADRFVSFIQNHDQVANSCMGKRIHRMTDPGSLRAMTALLLLAPATPMLFQGQEWCATAPFLYFADHNPELAAMVQKGRAEFLEQFPSLHSLPAGERAPDPAADATFRQCKLDPAERERHEHAAAERLHRDLLAIRRTDPVIALRDRRRLDGAVLSRTALVLRFFGDKGDARLLLVNLGADLALSPCPEPLLAPPGGRRWQLTWSSESRIYDGLGMGALPDSGPWLLSGHCALLLSPASLEPSSA